MMMLRKNVSVLPAKYVLDAYFIVNTTLFKKFITFKMYL